MTEFQPLAGATRGIGKGIAMQLGQAGATVITLQVIFTVTNFSKV